MGGSIDLPADCSSFKLLAIGVSEKNTPDLGVSIQNALPGWVILTTSNGNDGIDLARTEDPDVILLEMIEHDAGGICVCEKLKSDQDLKDIPVLILTSHQTCQKSRIKALGFGAEAFILMPFHEQEFGALIGTLTRIKATSRSASRGNEELTARLKARTRQLEHELAERGRTETILRANEDWHRSILHTAMDGFCLTDTQGHILEVNDTYRKMSGYSVEELLTMRISDLDANETVDDTVARIRTIQAHGEYRFESIHQRKDGSQFDVEVSVQYRPGNGGRLISFLQDISDRKGAEKALHTTKILLEQTLEQSPVPMVLVSMPDGTLVAVNPACQNFLGIEDEPSMIGLNLLKIVPSWQDLDMSGKPETIENLPLARSLRGLKTVGEERCILRKDGSIRNELVNSTPIIDDTGQIIAGHLVIIDITERKRAEEALKESEERVRRKLNSILSPEDDLGELELSDMIDSSSIQEMMDEIFELSHVPVAILDIKGNILVSTGWQDICRNFHRVHPETLQNCHECDTMQRSIQPDSISGYVCKNGLRDLVTPLMVGNQHVGNLFTGQFFYEGEHPDEVEFRKKAKLYGFDEDDYIEALRRVPYFDKSTIETAFRFYTRLANMICAFSHANLVLAKLLEEGKRSKASILELNESLEQRVEERTIQLKNAIEDLDSFSYSVSHDLRSPLRAIDGFSKGVIDDYGDRLDDDGRFILDRIRNAVQRMGNLIDGLLTLSRWSRSSLNRMPLDFTGLARRVWSHYLEEHPDRSVQFSIADGITAEADPVLLQAVLENLIDNASKYSVNQSDPKIDIGTISQDDERVFYVRDNGAGFDMEHASKLFVAFQRLHTVDQFPGMGIGLATVHRIIQHHGGRVWAEAAVNQGATFYFTLGE